MATTAEITTCQVLNKHDNIFLTVCTEWRDLSIKITVFLPGSSSPLIGQMKLADIDMFAKNLSKTREEYLKMTRMVLSGRDSCVEFVLKNFELRWKKGVWIYGTIEMFESKLEKVFPNVLKQLIDRHSEMEKMADNIRIENNDLQELENQLNDKIEGMITLKNKLEEDLYRKFIIVLNSKKEMIKQLNEKVNKMKVWNNSRLHDKVDNIYKADTEQEDSENDVDDIILKKNETNQRNHETNELTRTQTGNIINVDSFLSRNSASGKQRFQEEIKFLKRQLSSDSDGKMIDSDYEEDTKLKRNNKNTKLEMIDTTKSKLEFKSKTSINDNEIYVKTEDEEGEKKIDETKEKFIGIANNARKSLLTFESEESEEDMFA